MLKTEPLVFLSFSFVIVNGHVRHAGAVYFDYINICFNFCLTFSDTGWWDQYNFEMVVVCQLGLASDQVLKLCRAIIHETILNLKVLSQIATQMP